jgi:hypothetical protein
MEGVQNLRDVKKKIIFFEVGQQTIEKIKERKLQLLGDLLSFRES